MCTSGPALSDCDDNDPSMLAREIVEYRLEFCHMMISAPKTHARSPGRNPKRELELLLNDLRDPLLSSRFALCVLATL
jgi:hypothetical protein